MLVDWDSPIADCTWAFSTSASAYFRSEGPVLRDSSLKDAAVVAKLAVGISHVVDSL